VDAEGGRPEANMMRLIQTYQDELNALVEPLQARATRQDARVGEQIRAAIQPHLPLDLWTESLSRLALDFVASTPGVSCVLCGMRHSTYVADAAGILTLPPVPDVVAIAQALADATRPS
jgi:aryl-alcohol dehydrogenase-like predicted oxidoreductase